MVAREQVAVYCCPSFASEPRSIRYQFFERRHYGGAFEEFRSISERGIDMHERLGRALLFLLAIIIVTQPDDASTKRALVVQNIQDYRAAYPNQADPDARTVITMVSGARYGVRETIDQISTLI